MDVGLRARDGRRGVGGPRALGLIFAEEGEKREEGTSHGAETVGREERSVGSVVVVVAVVAGGRVMVSYVIPRKDMSE